MNGRRTNRPQSGFAITAASDTPFLPADLVDRLCSASGEGAPNLAVARSADGLHPVFGRSVAYDACSRS
ncbi:MAG TPA: NTP transferase domain-containing protein [Methyloceanibacter sp.]|nr:NTP transferase domain-containing protein [Methyloceanibacter sp.]